MAAKRPPPAWAWACASKASTARPLTAEARPSADAYGQAAGRASGSTRTALQRVVISGMKSDRLARTLFVAAVLFLVFLIGFASSQFKFFPHRFLSKALNQGAALFHERADTQAMHPPRHDFTGVRAWDLRAPVAPESIIAKTGEYVLLSSYWPECEWRPGLRLIDRGGTIVHTWDAKEAMGIWPGRSSLLDRLASFTYIHGSHLFENGDVLMNIEYLGLVRMNAAGQVVWKLDRQTHHSIHQAENGNFWVCEARIVDSAEEASRRFQGLLAPLVEDRVIEVTPGGEVVSEISILELLYQSEYRNRLLSYPVGTTRNWDILHLNDVEPLPAAMAAQYPGLAAGDLLVSMRDISTVLVFDRTTKKIKWAIEGRTLRQHDPDFIGGGWISVFDNNSDETPGRREARRQQDRRVPHRDR